MSWLFVVKPGAMDGVRRLPGSAPGAPASGPRAPAGAPGLLPGGRTPAHGHAGRVPAIPSIPPPLQVLRAGDRVLARVVSLGRRGLVRLDIGGYMVEAAAEVELVPGRLLWLEVAAREPGRMVLRPVEAPGMAASREPGGPGMPGGAPGDAPGSAAGDTPGAGRSVAGERHAGGGSSEAGRWVSVATARLHVEGAGVLEVRFEVLASVAAEPRLPGSSAETGLPDARRDSSVSGSSPGSPAAGSPVGAAGGGGPRSSGDSPAHDLVPGERPASASGPLLAPMPPEVDEAGQGSRSRAHARPGPAGEMPGTGQAGGETGGGPQAGGPASGPSGGTGNLQAEAGAGQRADGRQLPGGPAPHRGETAWPEPGRPHGHDDRPAPSNDASPRAPWPRRWRLTLSFTLPHTGCWDWEVAGWGDRAAVRLAVEERLAGIIAGDAELRGALAGILREAGLVPAGVHISGGGGPAGPARAGTGGGTTGTGGPAGATGPAGPPASPAPASRPRLAGDVPGGGFDVRV